MIDAPGIVTALDGDFAIVRMEESGCGRCHEAGGCGGKNIGQMFCNAPRSFRVPNPGKSAPGDKVIVAIEVAILRRGALMCYGLPLLALFFGAFCGSALAGEAGAILGAIGGLFLSWSLLRLVLRRQPPTPRSQPFIRS